MEGALCSGWAKPIALAMEAAICVMEYVFFIVLHLTFLGDKTAANAIRIENGSAGASGSSALRNWYDPIITKTV